jgi:hypothetical protein
MPAVLAGACVGEYIAGHRGKAERGVEFPYASKPASEGITDPRNWSIRRRLKSSLRTSAFDSPAGFAMTASFDPKNLIMLAESRSLRRKLVRHPVDAG